MTTHLFMAIGDTSASGSTLLKVDVSKYVLLKLPTQLNLKTSELRLEVCGQSLRDKVRR